MQSHSSFFALLNVVVRWRNFVFDDVAVLRTADEKTELEKQNKKRRDLHKCANLNIRYFEYKQIID